MPLFINGRPFDRFRHDQLKIYVILYICGCLLCLMPACEIHKDFFNETCKDCEAEYAELKGHVKGTNGVMHVMASANAKKYKEFTEDRAKKLYEELLLQFLKSPYKLGEVEAARKARYIVKKQCLLRGLPIWQWLE